MALSKALPTLCFSLVLLLVLLPSFAHAFGAGNIASISKIEGQNWRHGDIEDTLLTILMAKVAGGKKFSNLNVQRVYFGNWLRDYSQAVDVGTVKHVPAEAIRIILWILGFLSFGYGTKEFEVTRERLGCYRYLIPAFAMKATRTNVLDRPEEHIDNPKDYADNIDARQYDPRLRGPVNEQLELAIDHRTGLKMYIASEDKGITTSAGLIRDLFGRSIHLGRQFAKTKNKPDLHEALRLLGTGLHCLEDFAAHSNYIELALRNCGEEEIFPHVGRNAYFQLDGVPHASFPIITGTFGGVDFLHSVMGEFSDKISQSELQQLEGTVQGSQNQGNSKMVKDLLQQMPRGMFGGKDEAAKADELEANATAARMSNMNVNQRDPAAWMQQLKDVSKQIYPIMEFHDELFQSINSAVEKIPILPGLIEKLQEAINVYVFSLIAPLVLPIISQVKTELSLGSSEVIQRSREKQMIVFHDDNATDPTHSMLSKDHFSNVLNEPAGKVASQVLKWVVPQLMECWDNERVDINRTLNRIIVGVFHHPALRQVGADGASECRQLMFKVVQKWWGDKSEQDRRALRDQLSRDGVEHGRNHKAGVEDTGHGGCQGLHMPQSQGSSGGKMSTFQSLASGGAAGGLVGGLLGGVGSKLLGKTFGKKQDEVLSYQQQNQNSNGSYTAAYTETAHRPPIYGEPEKFGQAQVEQTTYPGGGYTQEYQHFEQSGQGGAQGYGYQQTNAVQPSYGGGYDETVQQKYELPGGQWETHTHQEHFGPGGQDDGNHAQHNRKEKNHGGSDSNSDDSSDSQDDPYADPEKKERKRLKQEKKRKEREERRQRKQAQKYGTSEAPGYDNHQSAYARPESPHQNPLASSGFYGNQPPMPGQSSSGVPYGTGGGDAYVAASHAMASGFAAGGRQDYGTPHGGPPPPPGPPPPGEWSAGPPPYPPFGAEHTQSWYDQPARQPPGYGQQVPSDYGQGFGGGGYGEGGQQGYGYGYGESSGYEGGPGGSHDGYQQHGGGGGGGAGFPGAQGYGAQGRGGGSGQEGGWYSSGR